MIWNEMCLFSFDLKGNLVDAGELLHAGMNEETFEA